MPESENLHLRVQDWSRWSVIFSCEPRKCFVARPLPRSRCEIVLQPLVARLWLSSYETRVSMTSMGSLGPKPWMQCESVIVAGGYRSDCGWFWVPRERFEGLSILSCRNTKPEIGNKWSQIITRLFSKTISNYYRGKAGLRVQLSLWHLNVWESQASSHAKLSSI